MTGPTCEGKPMYRKNLSLSTYALRKGYVQRGLLGKGYAELYLKKQIHSLDGDMFIVRGFNHELKFFFEEFLTRDEADKYWRQLRHNAKTE